jgi:hypothetical protein
MALKKDMKSWAVKLRGRSFAKNLAGHPMLFKDEASAKQYAWARSHHSHPEPVKADHIRVRVRIEEIE